MVNACVCSRQGRPHHAFFRPASWSSAKRPTPRVNNQQSSFQSSYGISDRLPNHKHRSKDSFHLPVPATSSLTGFVMVEQVKSIDYRARNARFVEKARSEFVEDV